MTYILNPVLDDDQHNELVEFVNKQITDNGGELVETDIWGVQPLAYEIDGKRTGYYVNLYFNAPNAAIEKIERAMRITEGFTRYLTLKYDAKMKRHFELKKSGDLPRIFDDVEEETEKEEN